MLKEPNPDPDPMLEPKPLGSVTARQPGLPGRCATPLTRSALTGSPHQERTRGQPSTLAHARSPAHATRTGGSRRLRCCPLPLAPCPLPLAPGPRRTKDANPARSDTRPTPRRWLHPAAPRLAPWRLLRRHRPVSAAGHALPAARRPVRRRRPPTRLRRLQRGVQASDHPRAGTL